MSEDERDPVDWWGAQGPSRLPGVPGATGAPGASGPGAPGAPVPGDAPAGPPVGVPVSPYRTGPSTGSGSGTGRGLVIGAVAVAALVVVMALVVILLVMRPGPAGPDPVASPAPASTPAPATSSPASSPDSTGASPEATGDPSADPTGDPSASADQPFDVVDGRVVLPEWFSFALPDGFETEGGDGAIVRTSDGTVDLVVYELAWYGASDATDRCMRELDVVQIWSPDGTVEALPEIQLDGLPAGGGSFASPEGRYVEMYCIDVGGRIVNPVASSPYEWGDAAHAALTEVIDSWRWE
ncbi:hypothetical protein EDD28_0599 [Salana multivorans]|uniref:Uncharacterized protein n=1 Tax=Salana multivorans TaxID=120377 RepID=A0A3N2D8A8_9MICO|nr:hypothetical protein [Salana multivorans]ROR96025.1 hypothetical protein EDD28_0599 [Salana multivorans]